MKINMLVVALAFLVPLSTQVMGERTPKIEREKLNTERRSENPNEQMGDLRKKMDKTTDPKEREALRNKLRELEETAKTEQTLRKSLEGNSGNHESKGSIEVLPKNRPEVETEKYESAYKATLNPAETKQLTEVQNGLKNDPEALSGLKTMLVWLGEAKGQIKSLIDKIIGRTKGRLTAKEQSEVMMALCPSKCVPAGDLGPRPCRAGAGIMAQLTKAVGASALSTASIVGIKWLSANAVEFKLADLESPTKKEQTVNINLDLDKGVPEELAVADKESDEE